MGSHRSNLWRPIISAGKRYAYYCSPYRPHHPCALKRVHMLSLGGARGITAEVAKMLVRKGVTKLVLMGRTAPAQAPLNITEARQHIRQELALTGRPTPRAIEDAMRPLYKGEEARKNINCCVQWVHRFTLSLRMSPIVNKFHSGLLPSQHPSWGNRHCHSRRRPRREPNASRQRVVRLSSSLYPQSHRGASHA